MMGNSLWTVLFEDKAVFQPTSVQFPEGITKIACEMEAQNLTKTRYADFSFCHLMSTLIRLGIK